MRGLDGIKEAKVKIGELEVGVAVASSLKNAARLLESIRAGRKVRWTPIFGPKRAASKEESAPLVFG
jgi:hypothetical protein